MVQEFLDFLLDELHEDVNRVKTKPYVEFPDVTSDADEHMVQLFYPCLEYVSCLSR